MKGSARNIQMTSFDDLFSAGGNAGVGSENVQEIALADLFPFKGHPFKILDDGPMQDMVESIKAHGVLVPGIVRPRAEGGYEIIAGHRRRHALELAGRAGRAAMPVVTGNWMMMSRSCSWWTATSSARTCSQVKKRGRIR